LFCIPAIPTLIVRLEPGGSERMARVAIWNRPETAAWQLPLVFLKNYLMHLDPRFLFIGGDVQPRHAVPGMGQLNRCDAVLLPVGLIWALRRRVPLSGALLAAWLCGPIPAALTSEGIPHALRAIGMLVPSIAWSACGIVAVITWLSAKLSRDGVTPRGAQIIIGFAILALLMEGISGIARYWEFHGGAPLGQIAFENGQRQAWERLARERQPDQRVFVNGYLPYSVYDQLFFLRVPPRSVGPEGLTRSISSTTTRRARRSPHCMTACVRAIGCSLRWIPPP